MKQLKQLKQANKKYANKKRPIIKKKVETVVDEDGAVEGDIGTTRNLANGETEHFYTHTHSIIQYVDREN